ncbi:M1 family metallopeptidase [Streptomyces lasiicapitis]|uniref:Zinc metalloprotease n=1 Tax=Streptomyces lasiicapitis TaxID=1923961 RepID=A0ABQ2MWT5_9ACTN|nr:M1 family metallopeptidase [Streptomyces lasiicapitis]GGO59403.1 zinc metalloprotease [Streptomyces lasiicapitis]
MLPAPAHPKRRRRTVLIALAASTAAMANMAAGPLGWAGTQDGGAPDDVTPHGITPRNDQPSAGARSAGDRLLPYLGNGGYDVRSYDVGYTYRPGTTKMDSSVRIQATATQALSRFSLDAAVDEIRTVTVQGRPARFTVDEKGEKLDITPQQALDKGRPFDVDIAYRVDRSDNRARPGDPTSPAPRLTPWVNKKDGFVLFGQPDRSHMFFPANDYPVDRARFTFRITAPKDLQAVGIGTQRSRTTKGDDATTVFSTRDEVPTHVVQAGVGHYKEIRDRGPRGLPLRSYITADAYEAAKPLVNAIPGQMAWMEEEFGREFPLETYGVLGVADGYLGVALETATLSTFAVEGLQGEPDLREPTMVHEMVHQYFGDELSVANWDTNWISEGHAEYYQLRYNVHKGWRDWDTVLKLRYEFDPEGRAASGPPNRPKEAIDALVGGNNAGVLMLAGLRHQVGDATFKKIERTFFDRYRGKAADTQDYIDVANEVSGRDFTSYITSWLYDEKTPPMPGHPDWVAPEPPKDS